jgi:2-oxoglutarate dehydrogenase E1 component
MSDPKFPSTAESDRAREATFDAFRRWGYLAADLDWLGRLEPLSHPELEAEGTAAEEARRAYCGTLAVEFMHIPDPERRGWIERRMEEPVPELAYEAMLDDLIRAEVFENLLQTRYLGSKRFSIEGLEALIPFLVECLGRGAHGGAEQVVIAMSHRGRLGVMLNVAHRPPHELFAGFEDVDPRSVLGAGDVKYHLGATGVHDARMGRRIKIHLVSNPSHLEAVGPVALGRVRAKQERCGGDTRKVMPVILHGDAAFAGQGIVAETFNLAEIDGFSVGGAIHVIANNLIGFTAEPHALHSTRFATDVAKRLPIPILHINGEDPIAVVRAARIAGDYRFRFASDVVVDVIGYRRHGHSEVDDPTLTQPQLYERIRERPPLWRSFAAERGVSEEEAEELAGRIRADLEEGKRKAEELERIPRLSTLPEYWKPYRGGPYRAELEVDTGLPEETLGALSRPLTTWPEGFRVHAKIEKLASQRAEMGRGERPVDFAMAEALAFASLVADGRPVRFSGQDSRRGTFSHRHAVWIDTEDLSEHCPLQHVAADQASFEIYDSILSEAAVLGYEYGYSRDFPEALVLWEAQFGDFVNGAQVILDQFVTAGDDKWGLLSGLVLLLPHGFEGQGPEHSSARIERFLQLAAEDAIQICQPSSAAQYFHLLRRQSLRTWRKPLVVFTPKSMLRLAAAASPLADLARPRFAPLLDDDAIGQARRILVCSGKLAHELRAERQRREDDRTAILTLEQLYPFPDEALRAALDRHGEARDIVWVQEEPANMGALFFVVPRIERVARGRHVRTVKRTASASPATGSPNAHRLEQKALLNLAFG